MTINELSIEILAAGFERMYSRHADLECAGCGKTIRGAPGRRWCAPCEEAHRHTPERRAVHTAAKRRQRAAKAA